MKYFTHTTVYILIIFILTLFGLTLMVDPPTAALAAGEFVPLEPSLKSILTYDSNNLPGFFNSVFRLGVGAAALLAVIMIMIGGFQYLTSDIPGQKSDGKDKIKGAIYGLLLILLSVVILNVINPDITGFRLFNESAPVQTPPSNQTPPVSTAPILSQNVCYENVTDTVPGNQTTYRLVRIHNSETECTESCPVANVKFFCSDDPKILLERINRPIIIDSTPPADNPPLGGPGSGAGSYQIADVPPGQFCKDILGDGFVDVDSRFCGSVDTGQSCCGFFPNSPPNPSPGEGFAFPDTATFTPGDPAIERFTDECFNNKGGGVSSECTSESFDLNTDTTICEEVTFQCLR